MKNEKSSVEQVLSVYLASSEGSLPVRPALRCLRINVRLVSDYLCRINNTQQITKYQTSETPMIYFKAHKRKTIKKAPLGAKC